MKCLVPIPPETIGGLKSEGETGPGYQIVSVELKDGRRFDQVVLSEGCIIAVRGHTEVPFDFQEVASVNVNHNVGISGQWSDAGRYRIKSSATTA